MSEFTSDTIDAVTSHMNGDHPEDNLVIVRAFGRPDADSAEMTTLDGSGGTWTAHVGDSTVTVVVPWSVPISERAEIRREIVVMYSAACDRLGLPQREH